MQSETLKYHCTPLLWLKSKWLTIPSIGEDIKKLELLDTTSEYELNNHFGNKQFFIKLNF